MFQHFEPNVPMGQGTHHQINCEYLPVVPHKAVAEISKKRKPIGEAGCWNHGWQSGQLAPHPPL